MSGSSSRRGFWFPLVTFGAVILAASGFYRETLPSCSAAPHGGCISTSRVEHVDFGSSGFAPLLPFHNHWVGVYWLTAIPAAFLLTIWFLRRRRNPRGAVVAAVVNVVVLGLIVVRSVLVGWPLLYLPGNLTSRGLLALLVIAVGLMIWAAFERDVGLALFVGAFFVLALISCLYDSSNIYGFTPSPSAEELPNIVFPGLFLVLGGIAFGFWERWAPRMSLHQFEPLPSANGASVEIL